MAGSRRAPYSAGWGGVDGPFAVIAQVEAVLAKPDEVSAIRVIRDAPPTPLEMKVIGDAMSGPFSEAAEAMGVRITEDDIKYRHPAVIVHPIAIFR